MNTSTVGNPAIGPYASLGTGFYYLCALPRALLSFPTRRSSDLYDVSGEQLWFIPNTSTVGEPSRGTSVTIGTPGWKTVRDQMLDRYGARRKTGNLCRYEDALLM